MKRNNVASIFTGIAILCLMTYIVTMTGGPPANKNITSPPIQLLEIKERANTAAKISTPQDAQKLQLKAEAERWVRIWDAYDNSDAFRVRVPDGILTSLANEDESVVFTRKGELFLIVLKAKFADTKHEWMLASAAYDEKNDKWVQFSPILTKDELTGERIQKELEQF